MRYPYQKAVDLSNYQILFLQKRTSSSGTYMPLAKNSGSQKKARYNTIT
jgi:hypothetical protein